MTLILGQRNEMDPLVRDDLRRELHQSNDKENDMTDTARI